MVLEIMSNALLSEFYSKSSAFQDPKLKKSSANKMLE